MMTGEPRAADNCRWRRGTPGLLLWGLMALSVTGCGAARLPAAVRPPSLPPVEAVLYLIGDAGNAQRDLPILRQLREDILARPGGRPAIIAFLGDNIYGNGLRDSSDPGFPQDSARLEAQVDVLRGTDALGVFVPGNHDWADGGRVGLHLMQNQTEFIARRAQRGVPVVVLPADGCPGPRTRELAASATLVLIDTQWWLHDRDSRTNLRCENQTESQVVAALQAIFASRADGRRLIVLAHHPLETFGPHGGYFNARQMLFPLTESASWLWIPIPFVFTIARNAGLRRQDLSNGTNRAMRDSLMSVFSTYADEPFVYAGGHEHSLQVMDGSAFGVGTHLVSGAGSKLSWVSQPDRASFTSGEQQGELGFMKLEFFAGGDALLSVFTDGTRACPVESPACVPRATLRYVERIR